MIVFQDQISPSTSISTTLYTPNSAVFWHRGADGTEEQLLASTQLGLQFYTPSTEVQWLYKETDPVQTIDNNIRIGLTTYSRPLTIDWFHSERGQLISQEQVFPSSGPRNIIPEAVFTIPQDQVATDWVLREW
jgi:hypothetical protein